MDPKIYSLTGLAEQVARDPELEKRIKENPAQAIANLARPLDTDVWIYRIVVGGLAAVALVTVIGGIVLASLKGSLPEGIIALGSAAVGALAGLLAPSPRAG